MPAPNKGLITETNRQYYEGAQSFVCDGISNSFTTTFDTELKFYSSNPLDENFALNNFKIYTSPTGLPNTYVEFSGDFTVGNGKTVDFTSVIPPLGTYVVIQLKTIDGGKYGNQDAFGNTVEENYGSYQYIKLSEVINNFMMAYVGNGKLIPDVKRTDVIFHAKRAMQEFSYDTLKSIKSQELTVPPSLSIVIPQDYVNYVKISWIDNSGRKHPIYPAKNLTVNPTEIPLQDASGVPIQDQFNNNIQTESLTEEKWNDSAYANPEQHAIDGYDWDRGDYVGFGRIYGLDPQQANMNGWFTINDRENKISFSSGLVGALIVLEYISDGLAYDLDSRVPKLAEEAMYAYILHAIVALRASSPEYLVARLKQERSAKLRNAKIRLSNIKLEELTQVFRGQSKWIKH